MFDQVGFANAGRPNQDHILFDVFDLLRAVRILFFKPAQVVRMVVMIANRNRQDLLRFILFYHEPVQMRLDVARQKIEFEFLVLGLLRFFIFLCGRWLRLRNGRDGYSVTEVLFHELRDLGL